MPLYVLYSQNQQLFKIAIGCYSKFYVGELVDYFSPQRISHTILIFPAGCCCRKPNTALMHSPDVAIATRVTGSCLQTHLKAAFVYVMPKLFLTSRLQKQLMEDSFVKRTHVLNPYYDTMFLCPSQRQIFYNCRLLSYQKGFSPSGLHASKPSHPCQIHTQLSSKLQYDDKQKITDGGNYLQT